MLFGSLSAPNCVEPVMSSFADSAAAPLAAGRLIIGAAGVVDCIMPLLSNDIVTGMPASVLPPASVTYMFQSVPPGTVGAALDLAKYAVTCCLLPSES